MPALRRSWLLKGIGCSLKAAIKPATSPSLTLMTRLRESASPAGETKTERGAVRRISRLVELGKVAARASQRRTNREGHIADEAAAAVAIAVALVIAVTIATGDGGTTGAAGAGAETASVRIEGRAAVVAAAAAAIGTEGGMAMAARSIDRIVGAAAVVVATAGEAATAAGTGIAVGSEAGIMMIAVAVTATIMMRRMHGAAVIALRPWIRGRRIRTEAILPAHAMQIKHRIKESALLRLQLLFLVEAQGRVQPSAIRAASIGVVMASLSITATGTVTGTSTGTSPAVGAAAAVEIAAKSRPLLGCTHAANWQIAAGLGCTDAAACVKL